MFEKAVKEHKTGITKVVAIGRAYFQFFKDYPDYFNALIYFESHEMNLNNEASTAGMCDMRGHETLNIFIKAIQTGIKDGTIRKNIDPLKTATILWGETSGLIQLIVTKGEQLANCHGVNTDELIDYSFELNMCSLKS